MALTIQPVRTRSQLAEFISLPAYLYQGTPGYAAPLDRERRELLDPERSPFFTHGIAKYWIARDGTRAVGRVSAQIDFLSQGSDSKDVGLFGCLDAFDDEEVTRMLLLAAETWIRERGKRMVRGPFLLSINNEAGILLEGHLAPPMTLMPWQPPYLSHQLRAGGYQLVKALNSYTLNLVETDLGKLARSLRLDRIRPRLMVRGLRTDRLDTEAEIIARVFNDAWQHNWGFTPLTAMEVHAAMRKFRPLVSPQTITFVEHGGDPVAIYVATPNLFDVSADLGNRPGVFGWAQFLVRIARKQYRSHRVLLFGVASRYRDSVIGAAIAATAIGHHLTMLARDGRIRSIEAGWVLEDNRRMIDVLEHLGFRRIRRMGIFEKKLSD